MPAKPKRTLTARFVDNLKPPKEGVEEYWDASLPGFGLRVFAPSKHSRSGIKSWCLMARINGKQKRISLGRYPAESLQDARRAGSEMKDAIELGEDPTSDPEPDPEIITFGNVAEDYIRLECPRLARGNEVESTIRRRLLPHWKDKAIADLRRADATERTDAVMDEGKPNAANELYGVIRRLGNWATARGTLEMSPFTAMEMPADKAERDRTLTSDEIRALWKAWDIDGYPFGDLQKLLLVTLQRRNEVAQMRQGEIDFDSKTWVIPGSRTKNKLIMLVPLSGTAIDILKGLPDREDGEFLFTTTDGERPVSGYSRAKARADKGSKVSGWTWHDLRRTGRTALSRLKVPEVVAERVLNHIEGSRLKRIYNLHEFEEEKRDALDRWARDLEATLAHDGEVVIRLAEAKVG